MKAKVKTKEDPEPWDYTDDPADREYIDIMGPNESCDNPGIGMKTAFPDRTGVLHWYLLHQTLWGVSELQVL